MNKISVVMPVYNGEQYVAEAIESVLKQSFSDFELIIVDDGSTDNTLSVVRSFNDPRIRLIPSNHDFIASLNIGLHAATSTYIARMDADDRMHIDRLKVQYHRLEESPQISVCSSWMNSFGEHVSPGMLARPPISGLIEQPLLHLLQSNPFFHPTIMLRTDFLRRHALLYNKEYIYAEDYHLWSEVAKCDGTFYIESQPLLYYRISDTQVSLQKQEQQLSVSIQIRKEILNHLIGQNREKYPSLPDMEQAIYRAKQEKLLTDEEIFNFFYALFTNNNNVLTTGQNNQI